MVATGESHQSSQHNCYILLQFNIVSLDSTSSISDIIGELLSDDCFSLCYLSKIDDSTGLFAFVIVEQVSVLHCQCSGVVGQGSGGLVGSTFYNFVKQTNKKRKNLFWQTQMRMNK